MEQVERDYFPPNFRNRQKEGCDTCKYWGKNNIEINYCWNCGRYLKTKERVRLGNKTKPNRLMTISNTSN